MKCIIPEPPVTEAEEERARRQGIRQNDIRLNYADRLICLSLRENAGFGRERFAKYNEYSYRLGRAYIEKHGTADKDAEEYAVDSYYAMRRDIRDDVGWEPERELWDDAVFERYPPDGNSRRIREKHASRVGYAKGISFYVRQMIVISVLYLRQEFGWGVVRIARVFEPVRDEYLAMMRQFLRCSDEGDCEMARMAADVRKRYNEMGFFETAYN